MTTTTGARLAEERKRLGFSQINFATMMGISGTSQVHYELDRRKPDTDYLISAAEVGVDVLYIVTGERLKVAREAQSKEVELRPDEVELLNNYRHIPEVTRRGLWTAMAACAQIGSSSTRCYQQTHQIMATA